MYVYVYLINVTTCYYLHLFPGPYKQPSPPSPACHVVSSPVCLTYFWIHTMLVRGYNGSPLKIHRHTVHPDAFVVVILTVQLPVRKVRTFQQNVRFVLVTIRQIIGDVQLLKISKFTKTVVLKQIKTIISTTTIDPTKKNTIVTTHPSPNSTSENQCFLTTINLSYAQATQNKNQNTNINRP